MAPQSPKPTRSDDPVTDISHFLAPELEGVDRILYEILDSESDLIREVGEYICLTDGKKLRPIITLLTAKAFGSHTPPPVQVAAALEAVHIATLLHDDVIDKAPMRRGKPSVNARWGDEVAILMADFLYASAFELSLEHMGKEPLRLICQVTRKMCEGEMFQIEQRGKWLTPEDYIHIITCKTAYLFSACGTVGGMTADLDPEAVARTARFGLDFGLAFQITDDTLDLTANHEHWGKSVGIDLVTGNQTLPLILALKASSPAQRRRIEALMETGEDFSPILRFIESAGGLDQALQIARGHARQALSHLEGLEICDRGAYEHLLTLPEYVVARQY